MDLDNVLATYDGWHGVHNIGEPIHGAREFLTSLREIPANVCIWSVRTNQLLQSDSGLEAKELTEIIEKWMVKHDLPFDSIAGSEGKPLSVAYVDDRAVICRPLGDSDDQDFDAALRVCRSLAFGQ